MVINEQKALFFGIFISAFVFLGLVVSPKNVFAGSCTCSVSGSTRLTYVLTDNCDKTTEYAKCDSPTSSLACTCITNNPSSSTQATGPTNSVGCGNDELNPAINTAIGCIPVKIDSFIKWLLPSIFGIIGGISFLLMVYGFIRMATSQGDPKAIQGAKETITSAVTGLLLSIFALFILQLVAVNILHLPGLQ